MKRKLCYRRLAFSSFGGKKDGSCLTFPISNRLEGIRASGLLI